MDRLRLNPARTDVICLASNSSAPLTLYNSIQPSNCVHQLWLIRHSLTVDTAHSLVRALINSWLDYCNTVFATLPASQMSRLHSVLGAAVRLMLQQQGRAPVSSAMHNSGTLAQLSTTGHLQVVNVYNYIYVLSVWHLTTWPVSVCTLQRSTIILGCDHRMTINCSSQRHTQSPLVCMLPAPLDQHLENSTHCASWSSSHTGNI